MRLVYFLLLGLAGCAVKPVDADYVTQGPFQRLHGSVTVSQFAYPPSGSGKLAENEIKTTT